MIIPPDDIINKGESAIVAWFVQEEGDTLEEARASAYYILNPDAAEGLD